MYITELFDRKINWKWDHDTEAVFNIDEITYKVMFDEMPNTSKWPEYFTKVYMVDFSANDVDDIERWKITNSGSSLAVMATVLEILQDFFNKSSSGTTLLFTAREPSRKKLYSTMVKRFVKKGWEVFDGPVTDSPAAFSSYLSGFDDQLYIITKP